MDKVKQKMLSSKVIPSNSQPKSIPKSVNKDLVIQGSKIPELFGMLNVNSQAATLGTLNYAAAYNVLVKFLTDNYKN